MSSGHDGERSDESVVAVASGSACSPPPLEKSPSDASSAAAAAAAPLTFESLQQEYDSYKLKTRDWQSKVRDRDLKMRQQLQQSTIDLHERDKQLEALSKRAHEVEKELETVTTLRARAEQLEDEKNAAVRDATRNVKQAMEEEVAERQREVVKLRSKVTSLEERVEQEQRRAKGLHLFPSTGSGTTRSAAAVKVAVRVAVPGFGAFCFCHPSEGQQQQQLAAWVEESIVAENGVTLPPFLHETAEKDKTAQIERLRCELELGMKNIQADLLNQITARDEALKEEKLRFQTSIENFKNLEKLHADEPERTWLAIADAVKAATTESRAQLRAAVDEEKAKHQMLVGQLQAKVASLEEYKIKAQLVMKNSAAASKNSIVSTTGNNNAAPLPQPPTAGHGSTPEAPHGDPQGQPPGGNNKSHPALGGSGAAAAEAADPFAEKFARVCAELEDEKKRGKTAVNECAKLQAEVNLLRGQISSRLSDQLEGMLRGEVDALVTAFCDELSKTRQLLTAAAAAKNSSCTTSMTTEIFDENRARNESNPRLVDCEERRARRPTAERGSTDGVATTSAMMFDDTHPQLPPALPEHRRKASFDFSDMLQAHNTDLVTGTSTSSSSSFAAKGEHLARRTSASHEAKGIVDGINGDDATAQSMMIALLRREMRAMQEQLHQALEEVRDATLMEQRSMEQSSLLKEQIRELERRIAREKDSIERSDYAKNVILKLLTCKEASLKRALVPVVAEVLQLSPEERRSFASSIIGA